MRGYDAVWFDAGGVLVLPDPTVLAPLLAPYGGAVALDRHVRAHYAAMAVKSRAGHGEPDWSGYDEHYVRFVGVRDGLVGLAGRLLNACRVAELWRWPIPDSMAALTKLHAAGVPLAVVSNASGQIAETLERTRICQVGDGPLVPMRCIVDSHLVGVAKPDPAIFDVAAEHFDGVARSHIVYIGDSVTMDVAGATTAGLRAVLLDPYDDHAGADFERIRSVSDLLPP